MRLVIRDVRHPITGRCCSVFERDDGKWQTEDGIVLERQQIRSIHEVDGCMLLVLFACLVVLALVSWLS